MTNEEKERQETREENKETENNDSGNEEVKLSPEEVEFLRKKHKIETQEQTRKQNIEKFLNDGDEDLKKRKKIVFKSNLKQMVDRNPALADSPEVLKDAYLWGLQKAQEAARQKAKEEELEILDEESPDSDKKQDKNDYGVDDELAQLGIRVRKPHENEDEPKGDGLKIDTENVDENTRLMARDAGIVL